MSQRKKPRKKQPKKRRVARSSRIESLEARQVMSADPLGVPALGHHGIVEEDFGIPALSHHGIVEEGIPNLTHHGLIDEGVPALSHHAMVEADGTQQISHHLVGGGLSQGFAEGGTVVDPNADFWLGSDLLDGSAWDADLGHRIEQTLSSAHDLTGQDEVVSKYGFDGEGQTVVVIDSGIAYNHYALGGGLGEGYRVVGGWDFTENDDDPYDDGPSGSHGTHVAGIVGADSGGSHNGVATGVDLVGLRVFDDAGNGYFSWVESALDWVHTNKDAFEHSITAVNLSLGTSWNSDSIPSWAMLEDEFAQLEADGIFISVSAGNSYTSYNTPGVSYPAASDHVIPVMSTDDNGQLSYFSQRADYAIAAPGRTIVSTVPDYAAGDADTIDDDWASMSGTSMAAPYVAGASVLVREAMEFVGMTGIDQWDIYNHMMATADEFYDSTSSAYYKRLNLEAAIDALMPTDDYGSTEQTAHDLGTIDPPSSNPLAQTMTSGVISTLDDSDYFSFTAGATGTATFNVADATHNLVVNWQGAGWTSVGAGVYEIDVDAGQTYTFAIASTGGLGYYDFSYELESTFSPIEWGAVGPQQTQSDQAVSGEAWFSVTAGAAGYLTADVVASSGAVTLAWHDAQQNLLADGGGSGRVDQLVQQGEQLLLRVTGDTADLDLRLTNAVSVDGSTVTVTGTSGDDALAFTAGATEHTVSLNGVSYAFGANQVAQFSLGGDGSDRVYVRGGAGDDVATFDGAQAVLAGDTYHVSASGFSYLNFNGGSGGYDRVDFIDTSGDDHLTFRPEENDAFMNAAGVFSYAAGFERVNAYATNGGYDRVDFLDTSGNDHLTFRPEEDDAFMSAVGFFGYASGFERVNAFATSGGYDRVDFLDTSGNDHLTFRPEEDDAFMSAVGFFGYASGFERVNAFATSGGYDRVDFLDTSGNDHLTFRPEEDDAFMSAAGVFSYASGFERVNAFATSGGYDRVDFLDTSGNDHLTFRPEEDDAFMSAAGVFSYASGFERVNAFATSGGYDRVDFLDTSGNDHLTFRPEEDDAFMSAAGVFSYASGFERTNGFSTSGGYDRVDFLDTSGDDHLTFRPEEDDAFMSAAGVFSYASGFERTNGFSTSGGYDRVEFLGTSGNDSYHARADQNDAYMSSAGRFAYAAGFDLYEGYAGVGGSDSATFDDSSGDDHLDLNGSTASLAAVDAVFDAYDFDSVSAKSVAGGSDTTSASSPDYALDLIGGWS